MKVVCLWVLAMVFSVATNAAFAKQINVYKVVASQKTAKTGGKSQGPQKNSSCINGTGISSKKK